MMSNRHSDSDELEGDRAMVVNLGILEPMVTGTVLVTMSETETDLELAAPSSLSRPGHFLHSRRIIGAGEVRQEEDHCQLHVPSHWHDYLSH
jgi:hypothetical protein